MATLHLDSDGPAPFGYHGATQLRKMLASDGIISAPGVYDGLTARLALAAGFKCLYMTGAGTSMSRLGMADMGLATFNDMEANARMIASLDPTVPVIADADTGYGGPIAIHRTVQAYARAGVAGLHLEDQIQEKRCGQLLGKQIVDRDTYVSRIKAAVSARKAIGSDIVIIARTDARAPAGFDEAVERLKGAHAAGADLLFFEALQSHEEAEKVCRIFQGIPMLLNMVPSGVTPATSLAQAEAMGFKIVIYPTISLEAAAEATAKAMAELKATGSQGGGAIGPRELFKICALDDLVAIDQRAGNKLYSNQP